MSTGKRYENGEPKLNLKKVFGVIIALAVIVMVVISIVISVMTQSQLFVQASLIVGTEQILSLHLQEHLVSMEVWVMVLGME